LSQDFQQPAQRTINDSVVLTQSVHIPTCFGGGHHHHQGIHLVC